jgi:hypothetical protein
MANSKISDLTALTGANADIAADVLPIVDTSVTTTKKILLNELAIAMNLYKVGSFTRDLSVASGNVAYTGVGFKPKAIIFLGVISSSLVWNIGVDDGTTHSGISENTTPVVQPSGSDSIVIQDASSNGQTGHILTFDADGFTIAWVKTGAAAVTGSFYYLALR